MGEFQMANRSILVAVALAVLVSGVSTSSSFARSSGANGAAAAGAAPGGTSGGGGSSPAIAAQDRVPPHHIFVVRTVQKPQRCGSEADMNGFYDPDWQAYMIKCRSNVDAVDNF
jgi:hypothetical protein